MSKLLRFTFRDGSVRIGDLPPGKTLQAMWNIFKIDGAVVGSLWCAQFDHVAMIEVVEMAPAASTGERPTSEMPAQAPSSTIDRLAAATAFGGFKPPGEA